MQGLNVTEKGITYLWLALATYSKGSIYLAFYVAAMLFILLRGDKREREIFLPQGLMLLLTVYNPLFPIILNKFFDVNNEYYRFFWIAPVVILVSYILAKICEKRRGVLGIVCVLLVTVLLAGGGSFLYKDGFIKSPNIYKMPSEIPEIAAMIHADAEGRYDGDYYPRAAFEYDYEMCMRQYDASIMLLCDREAYLNAISGGLDGAAIIDDEKPYNRVLAVVALGQLLARSEFKKGLEATGTEYICISSANEDLCHYMENGMELRVVGETANHKLYHYELTENEGWRLPDYSDVWENY